ncbi:MAG: 1-deoxy-D-xylulose-5-phosphate reductoisomerase [Deltaproteobacteria bacterium]|nr:1-deoxy-D-xylulose-5-phosphate reductoisomerase [Deltaproteobacteria bacterium]
MPQRLAILGATGSIGTSTLDVVAQHPERFEVTALAAGRNVAQLAPLVARWRPRYVAVADHAAAADLQALGLPPGVELGVGDAAVVALAELADVDTVVAAIVGAAGVRSTYAAVRAGKRVALANKESLVVAGALLMQAARAQGATILPVDSEHSAVFQSLHGHRPADVRRIILTASGGPFRDWPAEAMANVTVEQALRHPNWSMGAKITIDSATMMNKGLELIEARWLFDCEPDRLDVVIHRESIIHALVEYCDGAVVAQLAMPDMRAPIAYALAYPERISSGIAPLDLVQCKTLSFTAPDEKQFPCLAVAKAANRRGGAAAAVLNAANEVAVSAFLAKRIPFSAIADVVDATCTRYTDPRGETIDAALATDTEARRVATAILRERHS